jgi:hypothetical protein
MSNTAGQLDDDEPKGEDPEADSVVDTTKAARAPLAARGKELDDIVSPILKVLLIVTVFLGGYEYLQRQQSARVEKSLQLVDQWRTGGHRDAYQRINDLVSPLFAAVAADVSDDQRPLILGNIGETVTGRDDDLTSAADKDADLVFEFFERAALCANERICDYDVLNTFLGQEAQAFWLYFSRYAEHRRQLGYAQYGLWTARFADGDIRRAILGLF